MSLFKEILYPYLTSIRYNKILFSITRRTIFNHPSYYFQLPVVLRPHPFPVPNSPFGGSQRQLGMCKGGGFF